MKRNIIYLAFLGTASCIQAAPIFKPAAISNKPIAENAIEKTTFDVQDTSRIYDLDEVVVVSQPKETALLRKQSISSSILTNKEINALGIRDLSDLSLYVPSFSMPAYGSRLTSSMYIRGIGARINNPAIGIYIDDMPLVNKTSYNTHFYQLDRVDVLRGPQGTLYGMNAEGGIVRMYSKDPMKYQGTDIELGIGTHLYRNIEFANYSKLSNQLALSIAGFYNGQNGFFKNVATGEHADLYNEAGGKAKIVYQPTSDFQMNLIADYQYTRQNAFPYGVYHIEDESVAAPNTNGQNNYRRNTLNSALQLKYNLSDVELHSTTSYQYLKDYMLMDQDYLPQDYMHLCQRQFMNALTQEFSARSSKKSAWQWTAGAFGSYQWLKTDAPVYFNEAFTNRIASGIQKSMYNAIYNSMVQKMVQGGMPQAAAEKLASANIEKAGGINMDVNLDVPGLFHTPQFNIGLFHESNIIINDRWKVTIGLRYDYNSIRLRYKTNATMALTANVMGQTATNHLISQLENNTQEHFSQLLPKIGLMYKLSDNGSNAYISWSKGYRAGGYNIQMFSDILQTELNNNSTKAQRGDYEIPHTAEDYEKIAKTISYKPEESWNYEFGAHLNLFGNKLHADFSGYYMQIRNQQLSVMAGQYGFGRMMVNAGKSTSCGIEVALRGALLDDRLTYAVSYGLTHSVFKSYEDEINGETISYKDRYVPFIPKNTISAKADYTLPINKKRAYNLCFGTDVTAQGKAYWDEMNTYAQSLYALLNVHADLNLDNYSIRLWGRNITNNKYNTFAFDSSASGQKVYLAQRGNPIQAGIDISLHF